MTVFPISPLRLLWPGAAPWRANQASSWLVQQKPTIFFELTSKQLSISFDRQCLSMPMTHTGLKCIRTSRDPPKLTGLEQGTHSVLWLSLSVFLSVPLCLCLSLSTLSLTSIYHTLAFFYVSKEHYSHFLVNTLQYVTLQDTVFDLFCNLIISMFIKCTCLVLTFICHFIRNTDIFDIFGGFTITDYSPVFQPLSTSSIRGNHLKPFISVLKTDPLMHSHIQRDFFACCSYCMIVWCMLFLQTALVSYKIRHS